MHIGSMHRNAIACLSAIIILASTAVAQEIKWVPDLAAAKIEATKSGKPILLHFGASWCRPCQEVETFVFRNPAVIRKLNDSVVPVRIDIDQNPQLAAEFGVKTLPTDVVITTSEKVIQKRNSPSEASGYTQMLDDVARSKEALQKVGEAVLNEKQQLYDRLTKVNSQPADQMEFTAFEQQRPLAPAASAPKFSSQSSSGVMPQAVVSPPMTAEARVNQPLAPAANTTPVAPEKISNPFALPNSSNSSSAAVSAPPIGQMNGSAISSTAGSSAAGSGVMLTSGSEPSPAPALEGDCPVTLLKETKWVKGSEQYGAMHRGRLYLFASDAAQAEFLRDPDSYSPLLAGYDPVIFHEQGRLQDGKKAHGVFMTRLGKQQVVLFESEETRAKFRTNPAVYLESIRVAVERADGK
jgi:thiol-disulfide isomerase/thioredoxin/YHS domain-containing protein